MGFIFAFVIWFVAIILAGIIANNKGRSVFGWMFGATLFPIIILILLALPSKKIPAAVAAYQTPGRSSSPAEAFLSDDRTCPECAETIKKAAKKCRFCGHKFEEKKPEQKECVHCKKLMPVSMPHCPHCKQIASGWSPNA